MFEFYGNKYKKVLDSPININKINYQYKKIEKHLTEEANNFINKKWDEYIQKNKNVYDGDLVELVNFDNSTHTLFYDYTKYHYTIACRNKEYEPFIQNNYVSNHISIPSIIKTKDNKILIISDGTKIDNIFKWKFIGGFWEKSCPTILDNIIKEMNEEIGNIDFDKNNLEILGIWTVKRATSVNVFIPINYTSLELKNFIIENKNTAIDNYEVQKFQFIDIDKTSLNNFINNSNNKLGSMGAIAIYDLISFLTK